jgi:IPT/TIG domain-containing protein
MDGQVILRPHFASCLCFWFSLLIQEENVMTSEMRAAIVLVAMSIGLGGCGGSGSVPASLAPSAVPQQDPRTTPRVTPSVTGVDPNTGSTDGGAFGTIRGTNFQPGATVMLGASAAAQVVVVDDTTMLFWSSGHAAGTVDVIVTNPGAVPGTLAAGFSFVPPGSFDFNGAWVAHAGPDFVTEVRFTIRDNRLASLSCGSTVVTVTSPSVVRDGAFSFVGVQGETFSGRLVSSLNASGMLDIAGCSSGTWWADKSTGAQIVRLR